MFMIYDHVDHHIFQDFSPKKAKGPFGGPKKGRDPLGCPQQAKIHQCLLILFIIIPIISTPR